MTMPVDDAAPDDRLHVVAGVLFDAQGRVLLARRGGADALSGLWEFPGGKVEPGETAAQALERELHEELGIVARCGAPLIAVPHAAGGRRLCLDVHRIAQWHGSPRGLQGQALAWVAPEALDGDAMPVPDRPVVGALRQPDRYLITPEPLQDDDAWLERLQHAVAGGGLRVQLRAPRLSGTARWTRLVDQAVAVCRHAGVEVLVNDDMAMARRHGIGVHLPSRRLSTLTVRPPRVGPVAASCHDAAQLQHAEALGCDFGVLGPVSATASHPHAAPLGWSGFSRLRETTGLPLYALGGLAAADVATARRHGAQGIAAIRGLWPAA